MLPSEYINIQGHTYPEIWLCDGYLDSYSAEDESYSLCGKKRMLNFLNLAAYFCDAINLLHSTSCFDDPNELEHTNSEPLNDCPEKTDFSFNKTHIICSYKIKYHHIIKGFGLFTKKFDIGFNIEYGPHRSCQFLFLKTIKNITNFCSINLHLYYKYIDKNVIVDRVKNMINLTYKYGFSNLNI